MQKHAHHLQIAQSGCLAKNKKKTEKSIKQAHFGFKNLEMY